MFYNRSSLGFVTSACFLVIACAADPAGRERDFHTSGNRDADQRAEQRITKVQQMRGQGEDGKPDEVPPPLYERLGGDLGVQRIVHDFVLRVVADPRTNWKRRGIRRGGFLGIGSTSAEWTAGQEQVARLETHLRQFIAVATGGPVSYQGRELQTVHRGMKITNAEFDASIGTLKASLDTLGVGVGEQKELLSIFEGTRQIIAEKR